MTVNKRSTLIQAPSLITLSVSPKTIFDQTNTVVAEENLTTQMSHAISSIRREGRWFGKNMSAQSAQVADLSLTRGSDTSFQTFLPLLLFTFLLLQLPLPPFTPSKYRWVSITTATAARPATGVLLPPQLTGAKTTMSGHTTLQSSSTHFRPLQ